MKAPRSRLIVYYAALAAVTIVVVVVVFAAGSDEKTQPSIAGGYDVAAPAAACTGLQMDVSQSGEFVGLRNPDGTLISRARLRDGRLKGDVRCARGGERALVATIAVKGVLLGTLGGAPLRAELKRDPPAPGALRPRPPPSIAGSYKLAPRSDCLGGALELEEAGGAYEVKGGLGRLVYRDGPVAGRLTCRDKSVRAVTGQALNRDITLNLAAAGAGAAPEKVVATKQRDFTETVAAFFLAVVVVMLFARLMGAAVAHFRQPRVMGEVLAGILLGPTVFGLLFPDLQRALFPSDVIPLIGVAANLGLIFYMFLVGLELDLSQLRGRMAQTAAISNTGVAIPMLAGIAVALPTYTLVGPPAKGGFTAFALFMGVSMSITAFPVLARILVERRMLKRPVGALALASAAIDDVTAWFLIALATAVATSGGGFDVVRTILLAVAFCLVMGVGVRPLVARVSRAYDEAGRVPVTWITAIFAMVLLAAFTTEEIGIALIFGAFIAGTIMPRHAGLTEDVTHRMEDFVVLLLLPLFFAYTGLKTNVLLLDRFELVVLTVVLLVVAIACKFGGTLLASRVTGLGWRESAVIGTLMNTRGPDRAHRAQPRAREGRHLRSALRRPRGDGARDDLHGRAGAQPPRSAQRVRRAARGRARARARGDGGHHPDDDPRAVDPRRAADRGGAGPAAGGGRAAGDLRAAARAHRRAADRAAARRRGARRASDGVLHARRRLPRARARAWRAARARRARARGGLHVDRSGARPGQARRPRGRRPRARRRAPAAARRGRPARRRRLGPAPGPERRRGARRARGRGRGAGRRCAPGRALRRGRARLGRARARRLAGRVDRRAAAAARRAADGEDDASRLLATASLLVQRFVGVAAEPLLAEPGREGLLRAAAGAGLLVVGLSDRWREEGLGPVRHEIAAAAPAPILFVRRGLRPGALAPRTDVTQFTWSHVGAGTP